MRGRRRQVWSTSASAALMLLLLVGLGAALAAGPPFPDPNPGRYVYDTAAVLTGSQERSATNQIKAIFDAKVVRVFVYTQRKPAAATFADAKTDAAALRDQWKVGGDPGNGVVLLFDLQASGRKGVAAMAGGESFFRRFIDEAALDALAQERVVDKAATGDITGAVSGALDALQALTPAAPSPSPTESASPSASSVATPSSGASGSPRPSATPGPPVVPGGSAAPPAGPPYPQPLPNVTVYDYAGVLRPATESSLTATIATIEQRTAAEIVVYSQVKPESNTKDRAEVDARALIDQWGVGRKGFDDGLAILLDMDASKCHGQVQLYAGPGFAAAFLSNAERQAIYDTEMLPLLRTCDLDGAVLAAMTKIDAAATPEHAAALQQARQINGLMGLLVAPLAFLGLAGWAGWKWLRYGRDPEYLDDPSILMPAPPADLTAASAALVMDGRSSRHTLTTAMLDLASRDELAFKDESGKLTKRVGIQLLAARVNEPTIARARRRPLGEAEDFALEKLQSMAKHDDAYIDQDELLAFGSSVDDFDHKLERHVVTKGWFREPPSKAVERWSFRGGIEFVLGVAIIIGGLALAADGVIVVGAAVLAAGIATLFISRAMPARTMAGAMIQAMLQAYRRTLSKTMEQARSMRQVVDSKAVPWLDTPDQALVWGVALGLREDVEKVLARSVEDAQQGNAASSQAWLPAWYLGSAAGGSGLAGDGGGLHVGPPAGMFSSSSVIPNFDNMFAAVGTIGNSPASSGSGGSGGFSGGGSGGGGGGAGGGF
jgi:uncharacterized membrane protein YgcG